MNAADPPSPYRHRLVGRADALAALIEVIESDDEGPRGALILGRRGIGKSRLLKEAERYAVWRGFEVRSLARGTERGDRRGWRSADPRPRRLILVDDLDDEGAARLARAVSRGSDRGGGRSDRPMRWIAAPRASAAPPALVRSAPVQVLLGPLSADESAALYRAVAARDVPSAGSAARAAVESGIPGRIVDAADRERAIAPAAPGRGDLA